MGRQPTKATKRPRRESDGKATGVVASGSNSPAHNQPVMDPYATPVRSKSPEERNNTSGVDACNAGGSGDASAASDSGKKKRKRENPGSK